MEIIYSITTTVFYQNYFKKKIHHSLVDWPCKKGRTIGIEFIRENVLISIIPVEKKQQILFTIIYHDTKTKERIGSKVKNKNIDELEKELEKYIK